MERIGVSVCRLLAMLLVAGVVVKGQDTCVFPAVYNFGDSNSDTGGISAAFQAIPWPYGMTFFNKPAGRASDGRLIIDFIAGNLRMPYLSAYLNSLGANFTYGANFATGGSTIRQQNVTYNQTGISPFSLDYQIWQFDQFKNRSGDLYNDQTKSSCQKSVLPKPEDFSSALYTIDIAQNDFSLGLGSLDEKELRQAITDMVDQFSAAIQHLYEQGARYFWVHNSGPIGCLPLAFLWENGQTDKDEYGCYTYQNNMVSVFNTQLKNKVVQLRTQLPEAVITYVDLYAAKYELFRNAKNLGLEDPKKFCCGYHEGNELVMCGKYGKLANGTVVFGDACSNPQNYVSWDGVHYTEAANARVAYSIINGYPTSDPPVPITQACIRTQGGSSTPEMAAYLDQQKVDGSKQASVLFY